MNEALGRRIPATVFIDVCPNCGRDYYQIQLFDDGLDKCDACCTRKELYQRKYNRARKRKPKTGRKSGWQILREPGVRRYNQSKLVDKRGGTG